MLNPRKLILPFAAVMALATASGVSAATTATQNVTFTVAKGIAIVSNGNVTTAPATIDPTSGTPTGTATGGLTVSSNDTAGFQLAAKTAAATVQETGTCTPANSTNVNVMAISVGAASGGSSGSGGTAGAAITLSTSNQNLYSTMPTMVGPSVAVATNYTVTPGYSTPPNLSGCSYVIPVTYTVTAQ